MVVDLYDIISDQAAPVCVDKVKAVIISKPVEECDMEPQRVCRQTTKLVPGLVPQEECVQVPKEVCAMSKINPKKIKVPFIKNWCYHPKELSTALNLSLPFNFSTPSTTALPQFEPVIAEEEDNQFFEEYHDPSTTGK